MPVFASIPVSNHLTPFTSSLSSVGSSGNTAENLPAADVKTLPSSAGAVDAGGVDELFGVEVVSGSFNDDFGSHTAMARTAVSKDSRPFTVFAAHLYASASRFCSSLS